MEEFKMMSAVHFYPTVIYIIKMKSESCAKNLIKSTQQWYMFQNYYLLEKLLHLIHPWNKIDLV